MSLKPLKKSEIEKAKSKMKAKKRTETFQLLPPRILIVSEGTKTEPYYLQLFAQTINDRCRKFSASPRIVVEGTGRNTTGLYSFLEDNYSSKELEEYKQIWLVYDKDDFPKDRFDNAAFKADSDKDHRFHVAWSNESFELWLLWHYQDYTSDTHRKEYIRSLKNYIPEYDKGKKEVYEKILATGDISKAIKRGKRQAKYYKELGIDTPSQMVAHSLVYKLIEELKKYSNS